MCAPSTMFQSTHEFLSLYIENTRPLRSYDPPIKDAVTNPGSPLLTKQIS
jgi:hypothetical protein